MLPNKSTSLLTLALLSALATATPATALFFTPDSLLAQSPTASPSFPLPKAVPSGSQVRIDGSDSMEVINQFLKQRYEQQYTGTQVELSANGTAAALKALLADEVDLAAIGRSLTPEERAQGLVQVPISREKIAIVVSADNPFKGNLTDDQFARIFRGEITNWAQVGGAAGKIRLIDRPEDSDTRQAFRNYPVFKKAAFMTGATAVPIKQDSTAEMIQQLGADGIGYAIYSQVRDAKNVRILAMHKTLPDDPRYPFSQPRVYVYKTTPSPTAKDFLGYATAPVGQQVVEAAKTAEATAIAAGKDPVAAVPSPTTVAASPTSSQSTLASQSGFLAFSPDGKTVVKATELGDIQFFDAQGKPIGEPFKGQGQPTSFAFSPDGTTIAVGYVDGSLQLMDLKGKPVGDPIDGFNAPVTALTFNPDGQTVVAGASDGVVQLFERQGKPISEPFQGSNGAITALAFNPDGGSIAIGTVRDVEFTNVRGKQIEKGISWLGAPVTALAFNPRGNALAISDNKGKLHIVDSNGKNIQQPFELGQPASALAFSPDGEAIIGAGQDGVLKAWNLQGQSIAVPPLAGAKATTQRNIPVWLWWLLLPLALLGALFWWWSRRDRSEPEAVVAGATPVEGLPIGEPAQPIVSTPADVTVSTASGLTGDAIPPENPALAEATTSAAGTGAVFLPTLAEDETTEQAAVASTEGAAEAASEVATGVTLAGSGRYEEALINFDRAIEQNPYSFEAWTHQGDALLRLGKPAEALNSFDRAIELAANQPVAPLVAGATLVGGTALLAKAWTGKGSALMNLGRSEEALAGFDKAIELHPNSAETWSSRGNVLMGLGWADEARASYERAAQLQPPISPTTTDIPAINNLGVAGLAGGALAAGAGTAAFANFSDNGAQTGVEATRFEVGQRDRTGGSLADVDQGLPDLPDGYGESRIVLMPRDPQWAYAYWDVPNEHKEELRRQGGARLALRFSDVTDIDLNQQNPHNLQQYECEEIARSWYIPVPVSDRDYVAEIGYVANDGRWLSLARSAPVRIPPVYPSDWFEEHFLTISWNEDLQGKTLFSLISPELQGSPDNPIYDQMFDLAQSAEVQRVAGSLFGSMQHIPGSAVPLQSISSYVFPSGVGMGMVPTMSGLTMSGVGFSASAAPMRPRKFWLVADAELIVYGATEPDATVTISGQPTQLSPDGTFRFQMSFQDGLIDFPILAVAADGEQNRSIHMKFTRETPERRTNTKDEAIDEWLT
jgi:ABC-type phosphate transport system substrate-binding protein/Flp pilus assembly protein TadD